MFETITVPQRLSCKETLSVVLFMYASSRRVRRFILTMIIIHTAGQLFGYVASPGYSFGLYNVLFIVKYLGSFALAGIAFITLLTLIIYRTKPHLFNNISYEFSHWGVTRDGERTEFAKPWRDITKYKESKIFFIIFAGIDPHIIQKSMLGDAKKIDDFRIMLKSNISLK
jgi:hypothetical protein